MTATDPDPGHHAEFVRLLNGGHRRLLGYLVSLLGNRHDAEDVLQRASVTMWRRFNTFTPDSDFLAWGCTVAFYEAKNFQRAAARERLRFSDTLIESLGAERLADLPAIAARHEALEHCLKKLDDSARQLIEAAYFEEGTLLKLAESLGRAPQTLYNKLNLIRRSLADCVRGRLAEDIAP